RAVERCPPTREAGALHGFAQHLQRTAIGAEALTSRRRVTGPERVDLADAHGIETEPLRDAVHVHFDRELCLRRAEAAERAVRRRVGLHRAPANPDVAASVRTG